MLYNQELTKISLKDLFENFVLGIGFPILLMLMVSPSETPLRTSETCSNLDSDPIMLNVTFLEGSPFSYPK